MTVEEKMLWERAVQVLKRNTVTRIVDPPRSKQVLAKAREQATSHRRAA